MINSLYIFDRHCICIYYQDWHRTQRPKPAVEGGILPAVSEAVAFQPSDPSSAASSGQRTPRNTLTSGVVLAVGDASESASTPLLQTPQHPLGLTSTGLAFDEETKLVYGVVLSLRNMVRKLSLRGEDEHFTGYRTSTYKLHLYETTSGYKFVILTDPAADSMRYVLRNIYVGPFLEYVVRNPLVNMDSREFGIDNENFRNSIDRYMRSLAVFAQS